MSPQPSRGSQPLDGAPDRPGAQGVKTAESSDVLFAKLRDILASHDIRDFVVYTLDGADARIAFSCGVGSPLAPDRGAVIRVTDYPTLKRFLDGDAAILKAGGEAGVVAASGPVAELFGAAGAFRITFEGHPLGFILAFGDRAREVLDGASIDELRTLVNIFSSTFAQRHVFDLLRRDYLRTQSKLGELQHGLDVLLLRDRRQILDEVLQRALTVLGSRAGMIWRRAGDRWSLDHVVGTPSIEGMAEMEGLVRRCFEARRPGLVSSLSGEETWDFDVETIHMASVAVFPLTTRERCIGCVAAFDATVSRDAVDTIEGTALVGATAIENWHNAQKMLEQQRLGEQLALAAKAQQRLLPARRANILGLSVAHYSRYCDETGGDYVDTIPSREPYLCSFVVGDVSGHGLGAAMLMVDVRARLRTHLAERSIWSPGEILAAINDVLCQETAAQEFVTLFLCSVDTRTGAMRYASAGHEAPLVYRAGRGTWESLGSTGLPLGMEDGAVYGVETVGLDTGDVIVFATDGATEAKSKEGISFGTDLIRDVVETNASLGAETLLDAIVKRTYKHCRNEPFADDVTYLVVKVAAISLRLQQEPPPSAGAPIYGAEFPPARSAKDEHLRNVRQALAERYADHDLSSILICIDEALTNAVVHGNREDPRRVTRVEVWGDDTGLMISVEDEGDGFDPRAFIPHHVDAKAVRRESGRGILIMTSLMDRVIYWRQGRGVTLVKTFEP